MRRFYNPALSPSEADALDWANLAMLAAVDAALGNLSPATRALLVDPGDGNATLHFVVAEGKEDVVADDVEDTVAEFEASVAGVAGFAGVEAAIHVGRVPSDWSRQGWQPIYWAKGLTAAAPAT